MSIPAGDPAARIEALRILLTPCRGRCRWRGQAGRESARTELDKEAVMTRYRVLVNRTLAMHSHVVAALFWIARGCP